MSEILRETEGGEIQQNPIPETSMQEPSRKNFIQDHPLIILAVVAAITLGITLYTVFFPNLPNKLSLPGLRTDTGSEAPITITQKSKHSIIATTSRPDYLVTLTDQKGLDSMLDYLKVWGKTYPGKDTVALNNLIILLSNTPQPTQQKDPTGAVAFSYSTDAIRDAMSITIYLPDSLLTGSAPSAFFGASLISIASELGGTNKTFAEIPENNKISGFFKVESTKAPAK